MADESTGDATGTPPPPLGIEALGEVVCRSVLPGMPASVELDLPGGLPQPCPTDRWRVTARPRRDGIEVSVHRLVPYPRDPHAIAAPAYAGDVADTLRRAIIGALTASNADPSVWPAPGLEGPQPSR